MHGLQQVLRHYAENLQAFHFLRRYVLSDKARNIGFSRHSCYAAVNRIHEVSVRIRAGRNQQNKEIQMQSIVLVLFMEKDMGLNKIILKLETIMNNQQH